MNFCTVKNGKSFKINTFEYKRCFFFTFAKKERKKVVEKKGTNQCTDYVSLSRIISKL